MHQPLLVLIGHAVADGDLITVHCTMSGRQVGPFVAYDEHGEVARAFPATGRAFAVTHSHWFRMKDSQVIEHWANRDDQGMAAQLGWIPPTPAFLWRMARGQAARPPESGPVTGVPGACRAARAAAAGRP